MSAPLGNKNAWKKKVCDEYTHTWLYRNYGRPQECEGKNCRKTSSLYEWALKKGKSYDRKRKTFLRLCRSCHRRYDMTEEKRKKAIKNLKLFNPYYGKKIK